MHSKNSRAAALLHFAHAVLTETEIGRTIMPYLLCDSCNSHDLHSFYGISTYGRNVSTSLLGPSAAGLGQRDPIDVAIKDAP